jgi:hypothetical protein
MLRCNFRITAGMSNVPEWIVQAAYQRITGWLALEIGWLNLCLSF